MSRCRTVSLVTVRPPTATLADLDAPAGIDAMLRHRHEQFMANKERRWCSRPFGHDGAHEFTLTEAP